MKTLKLLILFCLVANYFCLSAQSNEDKAKAYYFEAKDQYDAGKFIDCIASLDKVEDLLGSTNPKVLNLKIKAYYDKGDYEKAKSALNKFSQYSGNAGDASGQTRQNYDCAFF
jgi:outer membrane protein assembly factor BamD (BamD/ComL family)